MNNDICSFSYFCHVMRQLAIIASVIIIVFVEKIVQAE